MKWYQVLQKIQLNWCQNFKVGLESGILLLIALSTYQHIKWLFISIFVFVTFKNEKYERNRYSDDTLAKKITAAVEKVYPPFEEMKWFS